MHVSNELFPVFGKLLKPHISFICTVSGKQISEGQCFCATCGSKCPPRLSTDVPFGETEGKQRVLKFSEFPQNRNSDFDTLTHVKAVERGDRFVTKRKEKQGADMVKVSGSFKLEIAFT